MSKTNVIKNTQYSAMPLEHLKDNRLSLQAKGLMSEMIVDDKTEFTLKELFKFGSEEEILVSIAELGNYGYITNHSYDLDEYEQFAMHFSLSSQNRTVSPA